MKKRTSGVPVARRVGAGRGPEDYKLVTSFKALVTKPGSATRLEGIEWDTVVGKMQKVAKLYPAELKLYYDPDSKTLYHPPQKALQAVGDGGAYYGGVGVMMTEPFDRSRFPNSLLDVHTHPRPFLEKLVLEQVSRMKDSPVIKSEWDVFTATVQESMIQFMLHQIPSDEDIEGCHPGDAYAVVSESGVVFFGVTESVRGLKNSGVNVKFAISNIGADWVGRTTLGGDAHGGAPFGFDFMKVSGDVSSLYFEKMKRSMTLAQQRNQAVAMQKVFFNPNKDNTQKMKVLFDATAELVKQQPVDFQAYRFALRKVADAHPRWKHLPEVVVLSTDLAAFRKEMARKLQAKEARVKRETARQPGKATVRRTAKRKPSVPVSNTQVAIDVLFAAMVSGCMYLMDGFLFADWVEPA